MTEPTRLFYPRPLAHEFCNAPVEGSDFVCATLDFDGGVQHPLARALPALMVLPLHDVSRIERTLDLLGQRLLASRLFEVLLLQLMRWLLDHAGQLALPQGLFMGLSEPRLARTLVALHERPGQDWPLTRLAAVAGMSRTAFAAAFHGHLGQTPADHVLRWRVSIACGLLREGRSIKTVADQLGYGNASSLSRAFKHVTSATPCAWIAYDPSAQSRGQLVTFAG